MSSRIESGSVDPTDHQDGVGNAAAPHNADRQIPAIIPAQTALVVMHYQTDILALFPSVAATLLANTRKLCDAARAKNISVYFAKIHFSPGYPEVSPLNRNGQGIKTTRSFRRRQRSHRNSVSGPLNRSSSRIVPACFSVLDCRRGFPREESIRCSWWVSHRPASCCRRLRTRAMRTSACSRSRTAVTTRIRSYTIIFFQPRLIRAQRCFHSRMLCDCWVSRQHSEQCSCSM